MILNGIPRTPAKIAISMVLGFDEAATVFRDSQALSIFDPEHSANEDRWITLGISEKGRLLVVVHTFREKCEDAVSIRIISCRKASKHEKTRYGEYK